MFFEHYLCSLLAVANCQLPEQRHDTKRQLIDSMLLSCVRALKHVSGCMPMLFIFNHRIVFLLVALIYFVVHSFSVQVVEVIILHAN
jgi:hypothetical protein